MNIYLSEIAPFCTTDAEKVLWLRLKKIQKFRIKRHSDSFLLESLLESFHIEEKYEPIMYYYEEVIKLPLDEEFPLWDTFWDILSVFYNNPLCTEAQKETIFARYKEVTLYTSSFEGAQDLFTNFFANILSLEAIKEREQVLKKAVKENDLLLEFSMRKSLILRATRVIIVNNGKDVALQEQMQNLIEEQTQALRSGKFEEYI
ncbi:hypothetical protein CGC50_08530 [Capnocytophaga gingivalis]|uniref:Uncharacterized protein n=1 Tax=Capnocytophaga gingivalis TaxID=1017 RepID=A0A250FPU4_9FLAO|nr:hypothetical protein [Capnocytophaga gingivalis]ATA87202.1 hypothetical protein CGC50_08530 [Capnocytophaga gingivalis]